jgi:hypothetical protein
MKPEMYGADLQGKREAPGGHGRRVEVSGDPRSA